jgi:branched-chain amino acid transport system ATP-binding protein
MLIRPPGKEPRKLNGLKPNHVTEKGLARTFQNIRLFQNMTVLENVMIGRHCRTSAGIVGAIVKSRSIRKEENNIVEDSYAVLEK